MRRRWLIPLGIGILASWAQADDMPTPERQHELRHLLRHDCGSCHGMTLRGGLGPALLPAQLQRKPAAALEVIIREGVAGTAMPPWGALLQDHEIRWLVRRLQEGDELEGTHE